MILIELGNEKKVSINLALIAAVEPYNPGATRLLLRFPDTDIVPWFYEVDEPYESVMNTLRRAISIMEPSDV